MTDLTGQLKPLPFLANNGTARSHTKNKGCSTYNSTSIYSNQKKLSYCIAVKDATTKIKLVGANKQEHSHELSKIKLVGVKEQEYSHELSTLYYPAPYN